jgi:hypothetical protein
MTRRTLIVAVFFSLVLAGASVSFAGSPASTFSEASRCLEGGWKRIEPAVGGTFESQTACVTYTSAGGAVIAAPIAQPHGRLDCLDPEL